MQAQCSALERLGGTGCDVSDNGLSPWVNVHMLNRDFLLAGLAALPVQRIKQSDERTGRIDRRLSVTLRYFVGLFGNHRPARQFHRGVMHRHRLRRNHLGFRLVIDPASRGIGET